MAFNADLNDQSQQPFLDKSTEDWIEGATERYVDNVEESQHKLYIGTKGWRHHKTALILGHVLLILIYTSIFIYITNTSQKTQCSPMFYCE